MIDALTEFKIKDKIYYSHYPINLSNDLGKHSKIVIDFESVSDYDNLDATPVLQFLYETLQEEYIIKNNYIVVGGIEDICLI